ncbi:iron ABC transporter permease [Paenibacillus sp. FSL A5-0031]|uniref:FecCD family ABC transporter permease n=1 Tax=Paenibacillus sp. FSL A5-0031 TaxID=1920420 RepID=UPI00096DCD35|nr:iron ABC transporter permease [Paenibacillus sp. FSL A5-0031]OME77417.1 iron ABC transporter permease [Paenibacillus sp. FSL A5-0031]
MAKSSKRFVSLKIVALALLLVVALIFSIGIGSLHVSILDVIKAMLGMGEQKYQFILFELRLPRITAAILVGAAMAISGAILQALVRNPLASPDLMGTTSGATAAVVACITIMNGQISVAWLPLAGLVGGCVASALTYLLAWKNGSSPFRMAMIGVSISSAFAALTVYFTIAGPIYLVAQALGWMAGTVYGTSWNHVIVLAPWVIICGLIAFFQSRTLNILEVGDQIATGVGVRVEKKRFLFIALSVILASAAVGIAGGISFIGLMAPHLARKIVGNNNNVVLVASALIGALLLLLADLIGRTVFVPKDIPAGIFTAVLGAPFFVYLMYKQGKRSLK